MAVKKSAAKKKAAAEKKTSSAKKKAAPKKAAAKKTSKKGKASPLIKDLMEICTVLDENSLKFLVQQAAVLAHNKKVEALAEERKNIIKGARASNPYSDKYSIQVKEGDDGTYFMVGINNYRNFFARDEMKKLVKICHAAEDTRDGMRRIYTWFERERRDILKNSDIDGPGDPALETIYKYMIKTYTVKD